MFWLPNGSSECVCFDSVADEHECFRAYFVDIAHWRDVQFFAKGICRNYLFSLRNR